MSATGVPASTCRKARAICSTLNRLVRIGLCLPGSVREPSAQPATYRFLLVLGGPTIREPRPVGLLPVFGTKNSAVPERALQEERFRTLTLGSAESAYFVRTVSGTS